MQKKLIALAVAGLASSAAFAQSNVTVYGVVDMYAATSSATGGAAKTSVNSGGLGGSRIGFKGVEDLGNGLKGLFTLEYALAVDANSGIGDAAVPASNGGTTQARQQFVGLTGGFGTAVAGRLQTAGYDFAAATNALHGAAINALDTVNPTSLITSSSRASNAVAYISPSFGGLTFAVNHARVSETATPAANSDAVANLVSATYVNGPLTLTAVTANTVVPAAVSGTTRKEWGVGGAYDFGVATLKASYLSNKPEQTSAANTQNKSDKAWQISGIVPVSAVGKVVLGYAKNTINTTNTATASPADNSKAYSLAYLHSLSKRTTVYAGYEHVSNDGAGTTTGATKGILSTPTSGGSARAIVAGVNHSF